MIDLTTFAAHIMRRPEAFVATVRELETAVTNGMVPNKLVTDAKFTLNRALEESVTAFLITGPHAQRHNQSDWWLGAYHHDALASGLHTLPACLKRAQKAGLTEYAAFLQAWMPVRDLLESAKPLIKKRGELPVVKTAAQIARDALAMTCQCCGRDIHAATGVIAHHGYERPGEGWQTASCMGARHLPFEASRDRLRDLIVSLIDWHARLVLTRAETATEQSPITREHKTGWRETEKLHVFAFTRANWDSAEAVAFRDLTRTYGSTFDALLAKELNWQDHKIEAVADDIKHHQRRYDGWKQTHTWTGNEWKEVA
jgi:hypothetical protein